MKCTECNTHPQLRHTGWSQKINKRAEWICPVCHTQYWYQDDGSLAPAPWSGDMKTADKGGKVVWGSVYKFKGNP